MDDLCPNCCTPWKCNGPHLDADRLATQRHAILNVLIPHYGQNLTREVIDQLIEEFVIEMTNSPVSWAFQEST